MYLAQNLFIYSLLLLSIGAAGSLIFQKKNIIANQFANLFPILASISGIISAFQVLFFHQNININIVSNFPLLTFSIKFDSLSALFVLIISTVALLASTYGLGYVKHYFGKYNIGGLGFFYNAFIAGMLLVVTAQNALFFLLVWELMSVASYFLVIFEKNEDENIQAGTLYFIMTHVGTAFILLAFLLLYKSTGSFDFNAIKDNIGLVSPLTRDFVFVLALIGFGTKAGIIPFHIWLPSAHPAAPSHVSALMSGVMIKTGIFMMIRIFICMMPVPPVWWGITVLLVGAVSALFGILYAITKNNIKRVLAYSSIENIGIILLGLGSSLIFSSLGLANLAALSLVATLFHIFNHAIFKALLFLGAGAIISKTHTKDLEEYGGLIKLMPITAIFFLVGAVAISGFPPFNGFASEWLTFQSLFSGIQVESSVQWVFVIGAGALAITSGLAAACFIKVFGIAFLAKPRSDKAREASEVSPTLLFGMGALALLALIFGILSGPISHVLAHIASTLSPATSSTIFTNFQVNSMQTPANFAAVSLPNLLLVIALFLLTTYFAVRVINRKQKTVQGLTWDCGTDLTPRMEITATGLVRSLINIFRNVLKPTKEIEIEYSTSNPRYFAQKRTVNLETINVYKQNFYKPLKIVLTSLSEYARKTQSGNVNTYILYIFAVLIILLITGVIR